MNNTVWKKIKIGILSLSTLGLLAACNMTDDYEESPDMGPPPAEDPADQQPGADDPATEDPAEADPGTEDGEDAS